MSNNMRKIFIAYEKTISDKQFEIEQVALADWLLQPREF